MKKWRDKLGERERNHFYVAAAAERLYFWLETLSFVHSHRYIQTYTGAWAREMCLNLVEIWQISTRLQLRQNHVFRCQNTLFSNKVFGGATMNAINQCMHCIELAACTVFYNAMCSTVNIQPINRVIGKRWFVHTKRSLWVIRQKISIWYIFSGSFYRIL